MIHIPFNFAVDVDRRRGGNTSLFFLVGFVIIIYRMFSLSSAGMSALQV